MTGNLAFDWAERGRIPDTVLRRGIRLLLKRRLKSLSPSDCEMRAAAAEAFVRRMDKAPIAPAPQMANEQHYEIPVDFFEQVLGERRKYSCCYWRPDCADLNSAEAAALAITCERAHLKDGMDILELGCGWGSLTL